MIALKIWLLAYLVNSLWRIPVVFSAAWLSARLARGISVRLEHRIWVVALLLEAVLPACTWRIGDLWRTLLSWSTGTADSSGEVHVVLGGGTIGTQGLLHVPDWASGTIVLMYGCTVVYFAMHMAWGVWKTHQLQRDAQPVTLPNAMGLTWQRCCRHFSLGAASVAVSSGISGPVTVGIRHGVMLLPPGFLEHVSQDDLEAVAAHEQAHMRRHDFAKNLAYSVMTLTIAYHPLFWITRSRMAQSREIVCDAMAADVVRGPEQYARSLLRLAAMLLTAKPQRTLHAIGIFDANLFERRVMNLTEKRVEVRGMRRVAMLAACGVLGLGTCASALALHMEVAGSLMQGSRSDGLGAEGPVRVSGGVMAGNSLTKVPPVYPPEAKEAKITGAVVLHAMISKEGMVENLQVVSGPEKLRTSALDAVRQWTYKPYLLNGEPTAVDTLITVNYSLSK